MATKKAAVTAKKKISASSRKPRKVSGNARLSASGSRNKNSKSDLVKKLLDAAEKKVTAEDVRASIGDVIRLLQLQKEMEQDEPREIKVQWIEREGTGPAREK
jgi:hypothetical protein